MRLILRTVLIMQCHLSISSLQTLRTPKLVPDDTEPIWSRTAQSIPLQNLKQNILGVLSGLSVYSDDPRVGPFLLLGALISFGTIWLRRGQQVQSSKSNQPSSNQPSESTQPNSKVTFALICLSISCIFFEIEEFHVYFRSDRRLPRMKENRNQETGSGIGQIKKHPLQ